MESPILKRVAAILGNVRILDDVPTSSFQYLGEILPDNSASTRRNLKALLEAESLALHSKYIEEYEHQVLFHLRAKLDEVDQIQDLSTECIGKLSANQERLAETIERFVQSEGSILEIERKLEILANVRDKFVIDSELSASVSHCNLGNGLLELVEKIEEKRSKCKQLLELVPTANIAVDSLNRSVEVLELVCEKIVASVGKKSGRITQAQLRKVILLLQERPHSQHQCLTELVRLRIDGLNERFVSILLHGESGQGGLELNAFDSARFLSDMFHWFLEQMLVEKEYLEGIAGGLVETPPVQSLSVYLDSTLVGVVEMVSERFEAMLKSTFSLVDLFKLSTILIFYVNKIKEILVGESTVVAWTNGLQHRVWAEFTHQWEQRVQEARLPGKIFLHQISLSSLAPFPFLNETVFLINSILSVSADAEFLQARAGSDTFHEPTDLVSVLSSAVDPLVQLCVQVAAQHGLSSIQTCVFLTNCFCTIQLPLRQHDFAVEVVARLSTLVNDQMQMLVVETTQAILRKVGLMEKLLAVRKCRETGQPLSSFEELHPLSLSSCFSGFYTALFTQGILSVGSVDLLVTREQRSEARRAVSTQIADAYEELYRAFPEVATHSPEQVRVLLDL